MYRKAAFLVLLLGILIVGVWSWDVIPVYEPLQGLDFQNLHAFQTCSDAGTLGIYDATGFACGDELDRAFRYPPALYHLFSWVSVFSLTVASKVWMAASTILMLATGAAWIWNDRQITNGYDRAILGAFWVLLLAQLPMVFQLERGNNDVVPIVLWTVAAVSYSWSRPLLSGFAAGAAVVVKIFPAIALLVVAGGLIRTRTRESLVFIAGVVGAALLSAAIWAEETVEYLTDALPSYADQVTPLELYSHSLRPLDLPSAIRVGLAVLLVGSWAVAAWRKLKSDPLLVFAGALAVSTYLSAVSWDYNLITVFPLLLLAVARGLNGRISIRWSAAALVAVGALASVRGVFNPTGQVLLQVAILICLAGLAGAGEDEPERSETRPGHILHETNA